MTALLKLLPLLMLTGGTSSLSGIFSGSGLSSILPLMLLGGGSGSLGSLTMLGLLTGNQSLTTMGLLTGGTKKRSYRRRRSSTATQIAYLRGAVSMLRRGGN